MKNTEHLKILLTDAQTSWSTEGLSALKRISAISVVNNKSDVLPSDIIDVVLHFGEYSAPIAKQFGYGRLGFWCFRFNHNDLNPLLAARIAAAQSQPLETSLWAHFPDGHSECMYQSFGFLEPFAIKRSVMRTLAKAAHFPARAVLSYRQKDELNKYPRQSGIQNHPNPLMVRCAEASAIVRKAFHKIFFHEQWFVVAGIGNAIVPSSEPDWILNPPTDRFWADPFPIEWQGRRWMLVEELPFSTMKGHLAAIELFADGKHSEPQTIMAPPHHLSYPFIFEWNNALYMIPESNAAGNVVLWQCDELPTKWKQVTVMLDDVRAADTTLIQYHDHWWMFTALAQKDACIHDELHLYFADSPLGPWQAHPQNPIKSDSRSARPAGNLFISEGNLYRPAQDCSTEYGSATVINRIDELDTENFSETPVARLDPGWRPDCTRSHHLSRFNKLWAVDCFRLIPRLKL